MRADLADGVDLGVARSHQQHEVPAISATCAQHDLHAVRCGCGRVHVAERPDGVVDTPVSYGPDLQAWCVHLMVVHAIAVQRCVELVASLTGAAPSAGAQHGVSQHLADLGQRGALAEHHGRCGVSQPVRVDRAQAGASPDRSHGLCHTDSAE